MSFQLSTHQNIVAFNKHGLYLRWPRIWILVIGITLIVLCVLIVSMEIGHTISDLRRSTAFGGFILFPFLISCGILIAILAFKPRLRLLEYALVACGIIIVLCLLLIVYDILVLIDPTRCFLLDCTSAIVIVSNSTISFNITGWPITVAWPSYFQTNMNAKRVFQSLQIAFAILYILFAILYIFTYYIYEGINIIQQTSYEGDHRTNVSKETATTPNKRSNTISRSNTQYEYNGDHYTNASKETAITPSKRSNTMIQSNTHYDNNRPITTYIISGRTTPVTKFHSRSLAVTPVEVQAVMSGKKKPVTANGARTSPSAYDRLCTRCLKEPRMALTKNVERENYSSYLCATCNDEILLYRRKPKVSRSETSSSWKP